MQEIERQFDYNEGSIGSLRLLGVLMFIMAPLVMWMTFQEGSGDDWFLFIPPPLVPWALRVVSLVLVWGGYLLIKGAGQMQKCGGRIAFTPTGLIWEAGPQAGPSREIAYGRISDVQVAERKQEKSLTFKRDGLRGSIKSSQMKSVAEFDEMAAMLAERTSRVSAAS